MISLFIGGDARIEVGNSDKEKLEHPASIDQFRYEYRQR